MRDAIPLDPDECRALMASERWLSKYVPPSEHGGCSGWDATLTHGYGVIGLGYRKVRIHRVALVVQLGRDIAPGLASGHTCHDIAAARGECGGGPTCLHRMCVEHLAEQSLRENTLSCLTTVAAQHASKDVCPRCGGPYVLSSNGGRICRTCMATARREKYGAARLIREKLHRLGLTYHEYVDLFGEHP